MMNPFTAEFVGVFFAGLVYCAVSSSSAPLGMKAMLNEAKSNPLLDYVVELQKTLVDDNGFLLTDAQDFPTSVLCLPDYDVVKNTTRDEVQLSSPSCRSTCSNISQFFFTLPNKTQNFEIHKAHINIYMDVIDRFIPPQDEVVTVNISAFVNFSDMAVPSRSPILDCDEDWHFVATVDVEPESNDWLEIDLNDLIKLVQKVKNSSLIEVALKFDVDCVEHVKVPLRIVNPSTTASAKKKMRKFKHQPFLAIFEDDATVKETIANQRIQPTDLETIEETALRSKRRTSDFCLRQSFRVNLASLGRRFEDVVFPVEIDLHQCLGSCTYVNIHRQPTNVPNHSRLVALAYEKAVVEKSITLDTIPKLPCCAPDTYDNIYLIEIERPQFLVSFNLYTDLIVKTCTCT